MAFGDAGSRRRGATYGKKNARSTGYTPASFEALLNRTPTKPKSSLSRIQSPAKAAQQSTKFTLDEEVFDVPPSDHEGDEARLDSLLTTPSKKTPRRPKTPDQRTQNKADFALKPQISPFAAQPRKRKRPSAEDDAITHERSHAISTKREATPPTMVGASGRKRARFTPIDVSVEDLHDGATSSDQLQGSGNEGMLSAAAGPLERMDYVDAMQVDDNAAHTKLQDMHDLQNDTPGRSKSPMVIVPSTPPRQTGSSNTASSQRKVMTTPRQRQLWSSLLDQGETIPVSGIKGMQLAPRTESATKRAANPAPSRRRLIDTLKHSANSSDSIQSSDSDSESAEVVIEIKHKKPSNPTLKRKDSSNADERSAVVAPSQTFTRAPKVTYGQQRSYLTEPSEGIDHLLSQPLDFGVSPVASKGPATKNAPPKDDFDVDNEDGDAAGKVRSIHELRVGGDTQRFDDQILTIIDDLKDRSKGALSARRSALMTLAEKLRNTAFKTRFTEGHHVHDVFARAVEEPDVLCGTAVTAAVILLLRELNDPRTLDQIHSVGLITLISSLLDTTQDVRKLAKERKANVSRLSQQGVTDFVENMLSSSVPTIEPESAFSPRLLALNAIEMTLRKSRESGNVDALLDPAAVSRLVSIAADSTKAAFVIPATVKQSLAARSRLETAMSILESLTITSQNGGKTSMPQSEVQRIAGVLKTTVGLQGSDKTSLRCLASRLLLNLSNGNKTNSNLFADVDLLGSIIHRISMRFRSLGALAAHEENAAEFDELLLSLGTLFNLAEMSVEVRRIVARSYASILEDLVEVFNKQRKKAKEAESLAESQANVAFGYLAVLLGILCQNATGLQRIRAKLPGQEVGVLVEAIEEFTMHHQRVDKEDSNEVWAGFTSRLQSVADALKQSDVR